MRAQRGITVLVCLVMMIVVMLVGASAARLGLQGEQAATTFSQLDRPPRERGTTWSKVRPPEGRRRPQYWHENVSRR